MLRKSKVILMDSTAEPELRAPEPLSVKPVQSSDLLFPDQDLDLSVSQTPQKAVQPRHAQVRFDLEPLLIHVNPEPQGQRTVSRGRASKNGRSQTSLNPRSRAKLNPTLMQEVELRKEAGLEGHLLNEAEHTFGRNGAALKQSQKAEPLKKRNQQLRNGVEFQEEDGQLMERAELNTVLALRAELEAEVAQRFGPEKAVRDKLESSRTTKNHIDSHAAQGLNFPRSQQLYRALVSVNLPRDQLISQALQERPVLTPSTSNSASQPLEAPDFLQFFRPDQMIREMPLLPGDHITLRRSCPVHRPAYTTFDLHHLRKVWDS